MVTVSGRFGDDVHENVLTAGIVISDICDPDTRACLSRTLGNRDVFPIDSGHINGECTPALASAVNAVEDGAVS